MSDANHQKTYKNHLNRQFCCDDLRELRTCTSEMLAHEFKTLPQAGPGPLATNTPYECGCLQLLPPAHGPGAVHEFSFILPQPPLPVNPKALGAEVSSFFA